jgi:hypothetical protein
LTGSTEYPVVGAEHYLVAAKHRDMQLAFALLLKFYGRFGRFPRGRAELHHGFRECTVADTAQLTDWLAGDCAQQERRYELVRDALLGECRAQSIQVLREFADEQVPFALPVACIIEARIVVSEDVVRNLDLLVGLQFATLLPLEVTEWRQVAAATQLVGGLGRPCATLVVACGDAGYLMTGEPEVYGEGIETIAI